MRACVFCGSTSGKSTLEHAIPKWARRAFGVQGELTVQASKGPVPEREDVGRLKHLNIVLRNAICGPCNNGWLASLEKVAAPVLTPMAVTALPAVLDAEAQAMLAFWAAHRVRPDDPGTRLAVSEKGAATGIPGLAGLLGLPPGERGVPD